MLSFASLILSINLVHNARQKLGILCKNKIGYLFSCMNVMQNVPTVSAMILGINLHMHVHIHIALT